MTTPTISQMNLYQKLIEIRKEVKYMKKSASGYKFSYATEGQLLAAIREKMDELGVFLEIDMKALEPIECSFIADKKEVKVGGIRGTFEFKWTNAENPKDNIIKTVIVQDAESVIKTVGGLLTYANRYFLYKFFSVPTDQMDPDAFNNNLGRIIEDWNKFITPDEVKTLTELVGTDTEYCEMLYEHFRLARFEDIESKDYRKILKSAIRRNANRTKAIEEGKLTVGVSNEFQNN